MNLSYAALSTSVINAFGTTVNLQSTVGVPGGVPVKLGTRWRNKGKTFGWVPGMIKSLKV